MQKPFFSQRAIDGFFASKKTKTSRKTGVGGKTNRTPSNPSNSTPSRPIPVHFVASRTVTIIAVAFTPASATKATSKPAVKSESESINNSESKLPQKTKSEPSKDTEPQLTKNVTHIPVKEANEVTPPAPETNEGTPPAPETNEGTPPAPETNEGTPPAPKTPPLQKSQKATAKSPKSTQIHQKSAKKTKPAPDPVAKARRRKITPQKVVMFLAGVTIVACLSMLAIWLFDGFQAQQDYQQVADTSTETTGDGDQATDQRINFDELKATNPDTVAWLRVPNTTINYPVVQTTDNATYLSKTFTGGYSLSGTIFLDKGNVADFSSVNSILYGHNRVDGTMFADLDKIYDGSLGNDIKIFLYLPDGTVRTYRVFSSYVTANDPTSINPSVTDFNSFAREMLARSERDFNLDPLAVTIRDNTRKDDNTAQDSATADSTAGNTAATNTTDSTPAPRVLTLSTCVANDDRRYLFHAVLTQIDNF